MTEPPAAPDLADVARRMAAGMRAAAVALQVMTDRFAEFAAAIESAADYQLAPPPARGLPLLDVDERLSPGLPDSHAGILLGSVHRGRAGDCPICLAMAGR